jgi:hypothetical protein
VRPPLRALWIDEGEPPDPARLAGRAFNRLYLSAREATKAAVAHVRELGYAAGLYWASTWDAGLTGAQAAELMNQRWLALDGKVSLLHVQFNVEQHDPEYVVELFARWRALRPFASTSWALEGFQGGWVRAIAAQVVAANVLLVPEAYAGAMVKLDPPPTLAASLPVTFDPDGVKRDLTDNGIPADRVTVFHDAAQLRRGWDGFAFTQRRLR